MGMERVVDTWDQLDLLLNLLARSGTGQHLSTYTNIVTGPRREGEADGPDELHVVILDNGRSDVLGTELHEILNCIRCGACLNVCPVYRQVGGHAYGWVYAGRSARCSRRCSPGRRSPRRPRELPNASTLCGACMDACPVSIPLQDLLLSLRRRRNAARRGPRRARRRGRPGPPRGAGPLTYRASLQAAASGRSLTPLAARMPGLRAWAAPGGARPRHAAQRWKAGDRNGGERPASRYDRVIAPRSSDTSATRLADTDAAQPRPPDAAAAHRRLPIVRSLLVDPDDLVGSFVRNAPAVAPWCTRWTAATIPDELLADVVARHGVRRAVLSTDPEALEVGERRAGGLDVTPASTPDPAPTADLGVTSAWQRLRPPAPCCPGQRPSGGRTASLLPPVHLCVRAGQPHRAPSTDRVLRPLGRRPRAAVRTWCWSPGRRGRATSSRSSPSACTARSPWSWWSSVGACLTPHPAAPAPARYTPPVTEPAPRPVHRRQHAVVRLPEGGEPSCDCETWARSWWPAPSSSVWPPAATTTAAARRTRQQPAAAAPTRPAARSRCDAVEGFTPVKADTFTIVTSLPGPGFFNGDTPDTIDSRLRVLHRHAPCRRPRPEGPGPQRELRLHRHRRRDRTTTSPCRR